MIASWNEVKQVLGLGLNVLLYGPPGTGKTTAGQTADSFAVPLTADTPAAELRGHYIPEGNKFTWHHGPAVRAWLEGQRLVVNEIDQCSGDAAIFLHTILDDPKMAKLTLPTGQTIVPQSGFHCIATMNGQPEDLHEALRDRFPIRINIDEPNPDAIAGLSLRQSVMDTIDYEPARRISTRQARMFDHLASLVGADLAARSIFADRATDILNAVKISKAVKA